MWSLSLQPWPLTSTCWQGRRFQRRDGARYGVMGRRAPLASGFVTPLLQTWSLTPRQRQKHLPGETVTWLPRQLLKWVQSRVDPSVQKPQVLWPLAQPLWAPQPLESQHLFRADGDEGVLSPSPRREALLLVWRRARLRVATSPPQLASLAHPPQARPQAQ